ncbi:MAG: hypothetical protein ABSE06_09770 [Anaerolineaceae bacterium]|jgi:hypothetical protein
MNKGIGFSRTITLDWLDATIAMCMEGKEPAEIRQQLEKLLSYTIGGKVPRRKTIDVLMGVWVKAEPSQRQAGLNLYQRLTTRPDRLCLHYGMILTRFPFFRLCTSTVGQIARTEDKINRKIIKDRVAAEMGHLGDLDRSIDRLIVSLLDWGILTPGVEKHYYKIQLRNMVASFPALEVWLLSCALIAHPSDAVPFNDLLYLPELFPFRFSISVDQLRQDPRFEVQRQGGGLDMVSLQ